MKNMNNNRGKKRLVTIVYFSFSTQTAKLVHHLGKGLEKGGFHVESVKLQPIEKLSFPLNSISKTLIMMMKTFFRSRVPIKQLDESHLEKADLVIIAGPTWSYNPSGPVLAFLDRYLHLLKGKKVLPVISCRKYWKTHYKYLKKKIDLAKGQCMAPIVFTHNIKEPWSTIGTFMTIAGINPRHHSFMRKHYPRYGHTKKQLTELEARAKELAKQL